MSLIWSGWSINVTLFVIMKFSPQLIKSHGATLRSIIKGNIFICYDFIIFKRLSNPIPGWDRWLFVHIEDRHKLCRITIPNLTTVFFIISNVTIVYGTNFKSAKNLYHYVTNITQRQYLIVTNSFLGCRFLLEFILSELGSGQIQIGHTQKRVFCLTVCIQMTIIAYDS